MLLRNNLSWLWNWVEFIGSFKVVSSDHWKIQLLLFLIHFIWSSKQSYHLWNSISFEGTKQCFEERILSFEQVADFYSLLRQLFALLYYWQRYLDEFFMDIFLFSLKGLCNCIRNRRYWGLFLTNLEVLRCDNKMALVFFQSAKTANFRRGLATLLQTDANEWELRVVLMSGAVLGGHLKCFATQIISI